jgi:pimeloyl-ACP methyl ester carboxylesterase
MPLLHPTRTAGVIGVNTPFLPRPPIDPVTLLRQTRGADHYIVFFQKPGAAEAIYEKDVARSLRFIFRATPKTVAPRAVTKGIAEKLAAPEESWPGKLVLTEEELQVYVEAFSRTGFGPGIEWYRNMERNWRLTERIEQRVRCPALMIAAENDPYLPPALSENMQHSVPDLERHVLAGCSHWTQSEKPDELNALLTRWLKQRFNPKG